MEDNTRSCGVIACAHPGQRPPDGCHELMALQQAMIAGELSPDRWQRDLVQIQCDLDEPIDARILHQCLEQLIARHDALRARLNWGTAGVGYQSVDASAPLEFRIVSTPAMDPAEARRRVAEALHDAWTQPLDVMLPPRLRALLAEWGPARYQLFLTYQETELDEHSGKLLTQELFELYDNMVGRSLTRLPQPVSFRDYLDWVSANRDAEACHFWSDLLANAPAPTAPPLMGAGHCDNSLECCLGQLNRMLSEESTSRLRQTAMEHGASLNTALLAAWSVVLAAHAGDADVRFAAVFSLRNQPYAHAKSAVAMCFSVLPFVVRSAINRPLGQLLDDVCLQEQAAREHSALLNGSAATRRQLGHPGAQSLIFFDEADVDALIHQAHPEWTHRRFSLSGRNPYAIAMRGFGGRQLRIQAWYNPQSYSQRVVNCLLDQLVEVLERLATVPHRMISPRDLLSRDHEQLVRQWEAGEPRPYRATTLPELIEEQVRRTPGNNAVVGQGPTLSYEQLSADSNRLAHLLVRAGLQRGSTVAICTGRTPDVVISVLGVLKAGGAYVPLDGTWPAKRIASVLHRLGTSLIITDATRAALVCAAAAELETPVVIVQLSGTRPEGLDPHVQWLGREAWSALACDPLPASSSPDDPAYVIFTSGSSGTPKGVTVRHRPVCNLIDWARRTFGFGASDQVLWVTSLGFDLSVFDVFGILACGGTVRIASDADLQSPERLVEILVREPITFWNSAPQALERLRRFFDIRHLPGGANLRRLRLVFLSGDWIPLSLPDALRQAFPQAQVISLGGATEATVWSNSFPIQTVEPGWRSIPYGRPMQNARYYVLDAQQRRCGIGIIGELFIGGEVLANGYAGDPQQTADRFVPDPCSTQPSARMYRTGDLARWWPDGNMELLGRLDHQVKVRGYRIELGEIEHALRSHSGVRDAVVIARRNEAGENQLTAYIQQSHGEAAISYSSLRTHLQQLLPEYMIPAALVPVQSLPLTANGKVDRGALLHLEHAPALRDRPYRAPQTPAESHLARVFGRVLDLANVGATDRFFELGGDSLSALGVIFSAEQVGLHLTMDMLRKHDIEALAPAATAQKPGPRQHAMPTACTIPLSPSQRWLLERGLAKPAAYAFSVWLQSEEPIDTEALAIAWQVVVDRHEALRISFRPQGSALLQHVNPIGTAAHLETVDLRSCPSEQLDSSLQSHAMRTARESDLAGPALPRLLCARRTDGQDLLLLFIPHIITDEYSGRIVIDDLGTAYQAAQKRYAIDLPAPTLPFSQWATHLHACVLQPELHRQVEAFCALPWDACKPLRRDSADGSNIYANARDLHVRLSQAQTELLLEASRHMHLPAASLVTAAVVQSLGAWSGQQSVLLDWTGAGRDQISESVALHRSVGYFSTIHPVLLPSLHGMSESAAAHRVHQDLQAAPLSGSLYGVARYLSPDPALKERLAALPQPEIKLNYHGRQPLCGTGNPFQVARHHVPYALEPTDSRRYLLNLEIGYQDGCLVTAIKYPGAIWRSLTMQQLVDRYLERLRAYAACTGNRCATDTGVPV